MGLTVPPITDLYSAVPPPAAGAYPYLRYALGELYEDSDRQTSYRFVRNSSGTTIPAGTAVSWGTPDGGQQGIIAPPGFGFSAAGVALSTILGGGWGFIQVRGMCGPIGYQEVAGVGSASVFPGCRVLVGGAGISGFAWAQAVRATGVFAPVPTPAVGANVPLVHALNDTSITIQDTVANAPSTVVTANFKTFQLMFE